MITGTTLLGVLLIVAGLTVLLILADTRADRAERDGWDQ